MPLLQKLYGAHAAVGLRYVLIACAAAWLLAREPQSAQASVPVGAAVGYLSFTANESGDGKFFITDTTRQVILTYSLSGGQLRLVSARRFDHDLKIVDGALKAPQSLEQTQGVTRDEALLYIRNSKPLLDALARKCGKASMVEAE
jgi:hypothetical protein